MKYKKQLTLILLFLFFWSLYIVTSTINADREYHKLELKIDSLIKFNPVFSVFYSLYFFEVLIVFILFFKNESKLRSIVLMLSLAALIHNIIFLIYPTSIERPNLTDEGFFNKLTLFFYRIDNTSNTFPSMHISLITIVFLALYFYWNRNYAFLLLPFYILTALSTVLIKQHYIIDIISGILVGIIIFFLLRIKKQKVLLS